MIINPTEIKIYQFTHHSFPSVPIFPGSISFPENFPQTFLAVESIPPFYRPIKSLTLILCHFRGDLIWGQHQLHFDWVYRWFDISRQLCRWLSFHRTQSNKKLELYQKKMKFTKIVFLKRLFMIFMNLKIWKLILNNF